MPFSSIPSAWLKTDYIPEASHQGLFPYLATSSADYQDPSIKVLKFSYQKPPLAALISTPSQNLMPHPNTEYPFYLFKTANCLWATFVCSLPRGSPLPLIPPHPKHTPGKTSLVPLSHSLSPVFVSSGANLLCAKNLVFGYLVPSQRMMA